MRNERRTLLKGLALSGVGLTAAGTFSLNTQAHSDHMGAPLKGNIKHSVARWTFGDLSLEELCVAVKEMGFSAIDLVGSDEWHILKKHGIDSSMCNGAELNLTDGFCDKQFHDALVERYIPYIEKVAAAGYKNLICFSGNKRGMDNETGWKNAVEGLSKIIPHAEKHGVVLQMELFNSKVDHPDCIADNSAWGIELCRRLGSENFKLLYDIYHMQIMEGDIIRTIRDNHQYFGHYHTAGVPGRHEIDDSQELYYPAIANAIKDVNFTGYLAQEFIPTPDSKAGKLKSLNQAIRICDV